MYAGGYFEKGVRLAHARGEFGDPEFAGILDDIKGAIGTVWDVVKGGITAIPGVGDAVNYIKAKVGEFFQLPARIGKAQKRAAALVDIASSKRMSTESAELLGIQGALASVKKTYNETESKLTGLLDMLKVAGFGALPLALIAVAVPIAAAMAYLFKTTSFNEKLLDKIEKKVITPKEAAELFGPKPLLGLDFGSLVIPALVVGGGLVAYKYFGRRPAPREHRGSRAPA